MSFDWRKRQNAVGDHQHTSDQILDPSTGGNLDPVGDTYITELTNNETFITETTTNVVNEMTEVEENNSYITQVTENNTFITQVTQIINNVVNVLKGAVGGLASLGIDQVHPIEQVRDSIKAGAIGMVIDGGSSAITTGLKGYIPVPFACTITSATLQADRSGSIVVNVWKTSYANFDPPTHPAVGDKITASAPPTISSAKKSSDSTLTGWTKTLAVGDVLAFNVDSAATIRLVTITLHVTKS